MAAMSFIAFSFSCRGSGQKDASVILWSNILLLSIMLRNFRYHENYNTSEHRIQWRLRSLNTRLSGSGTRADVKLFQKWNVNDLSTIFWNSSSCWVLSDSVAGAEKYLFQLKRKKEEHKTSMNRSGEIADLKFWRWTNKMVTGRKGKQLRWTTVLYPEL